MESLNISQVKEINEKKRTVKINENVIGPVLQNLVVAFSFALLIFCYKWYHNFKIDNLKLEVIVCIAIFAIINILRFLVMDEGAMLAYKIGWISANAKNSLINASYDILDKDNTTMNIDVLNCANRIITNHFRSEGIDYRTLQSLNFTRTTIDKARALLVKAKIIKVEGTNTTFTINNYKAAKLKLKSYVEG